MGDEQRLTDCLSLQLDVICQILETSWRKHNLHAWALHLYASISRSYHGVQTAKTTPIAVCFRKAFLKRTGESNPHWP